MAREGSSATGQSSRLISSKRNADVLVHRGVLRRRAAPFNQRSMGFFTPGGGCQGSELLWHAVIPQFFEHRIRPPFRGGRLLDSVAIAVFAVRRQRVAHVQVGIGNAGLAENLNAIVHAAAARPTILDESDRAIGKFENAQRIVFALGFIAMDVGAHLAIDRLYWGTPEEPVAKGDAVTSEIHQRTAA